MAIKVGEIVDREEDNRVISMYWIHLLARYLEFRVMEFSSKPENISICRRCLQGSADRN